MFTLKAILQHGFDHINMLSVVLQHCYFDASVPITLQVDASQMGVGAAILQNDELVTYASKAVTATDSKCSNIERELLSVVFGCEFFYTFIYGHHFAIESDCKPLDRIL